MYIYILLFMYLISLIILTKLKKTKSKNTDKVFLIMAFIPIVAISCFRSRNVGIDTKQFTTAFSIISKMYPSSFSSLRYESGFIWCCWILSKFIKNSQILIIISSLFINCSVMHFIKKNSNDVYLSSLLYILANFYFSYMNIMREAIAIAILLLSYNFLQNKKYIKYSLSVLFSSFFHFSAILSLLNIVLRKIKLKKKSIIIIFIITLVAFLYGKQFFDFLCRYSPRLARYNNTAFSETNYFGSFIEFLVYLISFVFGSIILFKYSRNSFNDKDDKINTIFMIMGTAVIFYSLVMKVILFNRFTSYFSIFLIIWLPNCIEKISDAKARLICKVLVILLFSLYWIILMKYRPEWYGVIPYEFFI